MSPRSKTPTFNRLGTTIRDLIESRGITQKVLAAKIKISEPSLSQILNGRVRPRQVNLSRILKHLCVNAEEEQTLLAAYAAVEHELPEHPARAEKPVPVDEIERVRRYMEVKSMAVAFEADVERALRGISLDFEHPCRRDPFICDFLLRGSPRVAIDCKFNVHRDWDREVATVMLLRENLPCDVVLIVVPYLNDLATTRLAEITALNGEVVALADLPSRLRDLRSKSRA